VTDRDALLAAIVANPDDTTARLVFADWLDETGVERDAAHAELIRVQCELSSLEIPYSPWCPVCGWEFSLCKDKEHQKRWPKSAVSLVNLGERKMELLTKNVELSRSVAELIIGDNPRPLVDYGYEGCCVRSGGPTIHWWWRNGFIETIKMPIAVFLGWDCLRCSGVGRSTGELWENYPCSHCGGSGRTDGIAAALFSRCPIWRVEFTDRSPAVFGNGHGNWSTGTESRFPYSIPQALFDLLQGQHTKRHGFLRASYDTVDLAIDALSRAAIAYARKRAGLPDWVPQTKGE